MADSGPEDLRRQATNLWQNLGPSQKIAIGIVGLLTISVMAFLLTWARTPEYSTVFNNLREDDAAAIVNKLKEAKTPYELASGGTTIKVPSNLVYDTRLQLAGAGLPQGGGVGFELFNQTNFGMTDFVQKVNYQRALEGELSRTINELGPVEQSRVHIVIPQPALYTDNQKEASASVVLKLKPGQRVKDSQVRGIAQLLGSSVEGLKPENITIVDANGDVLSGGLAAGRDASRVSASQLDGQRGFESDLEQRIQGMLDRVLGFGKATVRVRAQFDWDQYEATSEIYSPSDKQPQVRSTKESVERTDGSASANIGGAPGTRANVPTYASVVTGTQAALSPYEKRDTTTNFELSKTVEKTSKASGGIKKLSVAVVLDMPQEGGSTQIDEVSKLVSAAAGIDPARGDVLAVSSIPYKKDTFVGDVKQMEEAQQLQKNLELAKTGAMAVGPVLLFMLLLLMTRRGRSRGGAARIAKLPRGQRVAMPAPAVVTAIGRTASEDTPEVINMVREDPRQRVVKEQITNLVRTQPTAVADLIKDWMSEDVVNGKYRNAVDIPTN